MCQRELLPPDHCLALDLGPQRGGRPWLGTPGEFFPGSEQGTRLRLVFDSVQQKVLLRLASSQSRWHEPPGLASFPGNSNVRPCPAPSENSSLAPGLWNTCLLPSPERGQWFLRQPGARAARKGEETIQDGEGSHTQTCSLVLRQDVGSAELSCPSQV